jgi:hypothetical protein
METLPVERPHAVRNRILAAVVAAVVLTALVTAYAAVGWHRADRACSTDRYWPAGASSMAQTWSWWPAGFTCTYSDGTVHRSLWW